MANSMKIAVLPGDGIGPEVTDVAIRVLRAVAERTGRTLEAETHPVGWTAVQEAGDPLPAATEKACLDADAVFLGAVGSPEADDAPKEHRPETGLLRLRQLLGCYANLRPARVSEALVSTSPVRADIVRGTDFLVVRELAGGLYYGEPRNEGPEEGDDPAVNTLVYRRSEVERIARVAFEAARTRQGRVTSVDKANVLEVSRLWRRVVDEVAADYPDVELDHMLVDRAAMELVLRPTRFDVILTGNLFGDILSDEAAAVVGSLGVLGSASLGGSTDLYEPVHGCAPELAGRDVANPIAAIASVALMLRHTFSMHEEADAVDDAVEELLAEGRRTADLAARGERSLGTRAFGNAVLEKLGATA
ncbi:MAG: 3-isopropylmalate dehydrogenase [Longimicrobiales bacterium]